MDLKGMKFWKMSKAFAAEDGAIVLRITPMNREVAQSMFRTISGFESFLVNDNSAFIVTLKLYRFITAKSLLLMEDELTELNSKSRELELELTERAGKLTGAAKDLDIETLINKFVPDNFTTEEIPNAKEIINQIKKSPRSWVRKSRTTRSVYINGTYRNIGYTLRISDHIEACNINTSKDVTVTLSVTEPGLPYKIGSKTKFGRVTSSTPYKTTLTNINGNLQYFETAYLRNNEAENMY